MNLTELGLQVHAKRKKVGLMQDQLAKLSGLSRVTINQLENGTLNDIGYAKVKGILDILGMDIETRPLQANQSALKIAARSASTSYKEILSAEILAQILRSGIVPSIYSAHLMTLLDETPLPVVVKAIAEASSPEVPTKIIMKHFSIWAQQWKTRRAVWD